MARSSKKQLEIAVKKGTKAHTPGQDAADPMHELFEAVKKLTGPYVRRLRIVRDDWSRFDLDVKYPVSVNGTMKKNVSFVSIIEYRTYVGLYIMPVYVNPDMAIPAGLAELHTGKSCFKITKLTPALKTDIRTLLATAFDAYKTAGWV